MEQHQQKKQKKRRVSNCRQENQGEPCPGKYSLIYDGAAPVFVCDRCGDRDETWKKFYNEYMQLFKEKANWDEPKNHVSCLIGMFCYLYKEFYGADYTFVPKNPNPYSSKECRDSWTLIAAFNGNAHDARKYLVWVFKKGINKNTSMTNFGYILAPGLIRKYKLYSLKKNILTRASKLPEDFKSWCETNTPSVFVKYALGTMNDLGALLGYVKFYGAKLNNDSEERKAIAQAEKIGLIKNEKLNIGDAA